MDLQEFKRSLIDAYIQDGIKNVEFEASMMKTLFSDQEYELILYALNNGFILNSEYIQPMLDTGDLRLYQYLGLHVFRYQIFGWKEAITSGNLETVQWLLTLNRFYISNVNTCRYAAAAGHIHLLKWFLESGYRVNMVFIDLTAIRNGHLHVLQWLYQTGNCFTWWGHHYSEALKYDRKEIMEWVARNKPESS